MSDLPQHPHEVFCEACSDCFGCHMGDPCWDGGGEHSWPTRGANDERLFAAGIADEIGLLVGAHGKALEDLRRKALAAQEDLKDARAAASERLRDMARRLDKPRHDQ
jgi:hypothetical protein